MTRTRRLRLGVGKGIEVRKWLYQGLLAGSAIFTAGVGIKTQTAYDDFEPIAYGPVQNDRVGAYSDVVRLSEQLREVTFQNVNPEKAREVARLWVQGMRQGNLKPLVPVAYEDNFDVPAKQQILSGASAVAIYLNRLAAQEMEQGRRQQAVDDALLSLELSSVVKYSDFQTVGGMALYQKKALRVFREAQQGLPNDQALENHQRLYLVWSDLNHEPLSKMLSLSRMQYVDYMQRSGRAAPRIKKQVASLPEASLELSVPDLAKAMGVKGASRAEDEELPTFLSIVNYAYSNEALAHEEARLALSGTPLH
jgi:hypothetical protein